SFLNSNEVIRYTPPHPSATLPNYVMWDLGRGTKMLKKLNEHLQQLSNGWVPPARSLTEYHSVGAITTADALQLRLSKKYDMFQRLPDRVAHLLGVHPPV